MRFWKRVDAELSAWVHSQPGYDVKTLRKDFKAEARGAFGFLLTDYGFDEPSEDMDGLVFSSGSIEVTVEQDCIRETMVGIGIGTEHSFMMLGGLVRRAGGRVVANWPDPLLLKESDKGRNLDRWADSFSVEFHPQSADLGEIRHLWPGGGKEALILPGFLHNESRMREHLPRYALVLRAFADKILKGEAPVADPETPEATMMNKIYSCQDDTERERLRKEWDERFGERSRELARELTKQREESGPPYP